MEKKVLVQRVRVILAIFWGAGILGCFFWLLSFAFTYGPEEVKALFKALITSSQDMAPLVFLLIFLLRGLFLIPSTLLIIIAGALFEPLLAFILCLLGMSLSLSFVYGLARFLGKEYVETRQNEHFRRIETTIKEHGFFTTLLLMLLPLIPSDSIAAFAGVAGVSFADFFLGVCIGSISSIVPFVLLGGSFGHGMSFFLAFFSFFLTLLIMVWAWKHPHFNRFFKRKS